jgi:hypothetical protein
MLDARMNAISIPQQTLNLALTKPAAIEPNQVFLERVCLGLLGRPACDSDNLLYGSLLKQGWSREQVVLAIMGSAQYRAHAAQALYRSVLHRPARVTELSVLMQELSKGTSWKQVRQQLLSSLEYIEARGKGTKEGFLAALYADIFGQEPPAARHERYSQLLERGMQPSSLVQAILNTEEADLCLVQRWQQQCGHQLLSPFQMQAWVSRLQRGAREVEILAEMICFGSK